MSNHSVQLFRAIPRLYSAHEDPEFGAWIFAYEKAVNPEDADNTSLDNENYNGAEYASSTYTTLQEAWKKVAQDGVITYQEFVSPFVKLGECKP